MDGLDEQIEAAMAMLRAAGLPVAIDPHAPDDVKRAFLNLLVRSPHYERTARKKYAEEKN